MIVISDTTPIISLLKAGHLELLEKLYGNVLVPNAVYYELTENPAYPDEAEIIKKVRFLSVTEVENIKSVNVLRSVTGLDEGESEALIMYDEQNADLLLMDERKGRRVAKQLKAEYIGTAGVLMLAYDKGYIGQADVKICLDTMINNNIRLGKKICNTVMAHVGLEEVY
ncbi:MAG: DUF3368 domain-containing protein [Lachnospiraceae bacterium]|jgi:Predicted nucleic acid-binding protein, contains PIN domain|nr:DUF3368 domain-containing protein [Lachnospiraceae bacterium]